MKLSKLFANTRKCITFCEANHLIFITAIHGKLLRQ